MRGHVQDELVIQAPRVHAATAVQPLSPPQYAGVGPRLAVLAPRDFAWPIADRK